MRASIFSILAIIFTMIGSEVVATVNGISMKKLEGPNCQSDALSVLRNTTLILRCPNKPIEWIHRNTTDSKLKYYMYKNSNITLRIKNIIRENDGCYCCRSAEDFSVSCVTVSVLGPPYKAFQVEQDLLTHCDKPIDIVCALSGNPKPNITWQHYSNEWRRKELPELIQDQIHKPVLHVDKFYPEIGGIYVCMAENAYGEVSDTSISIIVPLDCSGYSQYRSASLTHTYYADIGENVTMNCSLRFTCEYTQSCLKVIYWWNTSFPVNRTTEYEGYRCSSCTVWKTKTIHNLQDSDFNKVFTCEIKPRESFVTSLIYNATIQKRPKNFQTEVIIPFVVPTAVIFVLLIGSAIVIISILVFYKKKITMLLYYRLAKEPAYTKNLKADVFISFASKDIDFVKEKIHDPIQRAGYKVIWYPDDFEFGGNILEEALQSIWKSRKTILCLSQNFLMSEHCKSEKDMCFEKAMRTFDNFLILIHLDDCDIPKDLKKLKSIEMKQTDNNVENNARKYAYAFSKLKYFLKAPIERMN